MLYKKRVDYSTAVLGDILCSDLSFVKSTDYASSGKTAIGVIFSNATGALKAISLTEFQNLPWSKSAIDITNLAHIYEDYAQADMGGRNNTDVILAQLGTGNDFAAGKCNSFSTYGTSAGAWYLPAAGELYMILSNFTTINSSLSICSGTSLTMDAQELEGVFTFWYYLSSTQKSEAKAFRLRYSAQYGVSIFDVDKTTVTHYDSENSFWLYYVTRPAIMIAY